MEFAATVLILTCTYALLAAGIVILYKAGRVVNFAHGELAIVGGFVFYSTGLMVEEYSLAVAIFGAVVFSVVMGAAIYMAMMRRLVGEPFYVAILVTVGIAIVLKSAIIVIWRAPRVTIDVGVAPAIRFADGATLSYMDVASVFLTIAFFVALYLFSDLPGSECSFAAQRKIRCSPVSAVSTSISCSRSPGSLRPLPPLSPAYSTAAVLFSVRKASASGLRDDCGPRRRA